MRMRSTKETLISMLCCVTAGLALASGMQIAASPIPGSAGALLAEARAAANRAADAPEAPHTRQDSTVVLLAGH